MIQVLVAYATQEGFTRVLADHVASRLIAQGHSANVFDVERLESRDPLRSFDAVILASPTYEGRHQAAMIRFVQDNVDALTDIPSAFLSISRSEGVVEKIGRMATRRRLAAFDVDVMIDAFLLETDWRPNRIKALAGGGSLTSYGSIVRWIKRVATFRAAAKSAALAAHDRNWDVLDRFVDDLSQELLSPGSSSTFGLRPRVDDSPR